MPLTILRPHYLTFRNRIRFGTTNLVRRDLLLVIITLIIMGCIFSAIYMLFRGISAQPALSAIIPSKIIESTLHYFFVLLLISNTVAAVGNLYTSDNLNLLLTTPTNSFRLIAAKFIETFLETGIMYFVFLTPAALAYVVYFQLPLSFLLVGILASIPFLLTLTALGVIIGSLAVLIISFVWRRGAIAVFLFLAAALWGLFALFQELRTVRASTSGAAAITKLVGLYNTRNNTWLPSSWLSDQIVPYLGVETENATTKLILLCASALFFSGIAFLIADFFLLPLRSKAQSLQRVKGRKVRGQKYSDPVRRLIEISYQILPLAQQTRAIIVKDLTNLIRDRAQSLQLILYCGIVTLYVTIASFMGSAMQLGDTAQRIWSGFLASMNFLISGFVMTTVMTRLVYPSVSLEGRAFWVLQVTPIDMPQLIRAKLLGWLPLTAFLGMTLSCSGAIALNLPLITLPYFALLGMATALGGTGLAIGLGAVFATFDWDSPNQISVGLGTLVLLLSNLAVVLILSVPATIATFLIIAPDLHKFFRPGAPFLITSACLFLVLIISAITAIISCRRGTRTLILRRQNLIS